MPAPKISIITATYNCSHILKYAVTSVLNSDFDDWELIVVGDHCTDDSEAIVAGFNDDRIRFFNLESNSGQQSTPNNFGLSRVRGEYVCYLNHDDMFLPWHLSTMLEASARSPDCIILASYLDVRPDDERPTGENLRILGGGPSSNHPTYNPTRWYIASSWFMPISIARSAGPWYTENSTFVTPSQDWLFRAWKSGHGISTSLEISLIAVITGGRKAFYKERRDAEHAYIFEQFAQSREHFSAMERAFSTYKSGDRQGIYNRISGALYERLVAKMLIMLGIHPNTLRMIFRHGGRGGFVKHWQKQASIK